MSPLPISTTPPPSHESYLLDQLAGERITLPGSKGVFRILASSAQTAGGIAVFTSGAVLSDAPGFHWHQEAHDVFLVTKGFLRLWNGDRCRVLGPGDFAYVPPKIIHNPELLGPHTETFGLVAPGDWVDFFRHVGETYNGVIVPEHDNRDLKSLLIPKLMASKDRFDVNFVRDPSYVPPTESPWEESENQLAKPETPYFLRANTGPRWILGGVLSRPFIHAEQTGGRFAISSIESSGDYGSGVFGKSLTFKNVDHCFCVQEGLLRIILGTGESLNEIREGQTIVIAAGETFTIEFASRFVRVWSFTNGPGIEEVIRRGGDSYTGFVIPEAPVEVDEARLTKALEELNVADKGL